MNNHEVTGIRVGSGTKVHAAYITGSHEVRRFGRTETVTDFGLPLCGSSIWTKRGGFGAVAPVAGAINCDRCLVSLARPLAV